MGIPLERTWALLADVEQWPEWAPHIRTAHLEGGALGPGSEGRFTFRLTGSARFRMTSWRPSTA